MGREERRRRAAEAAASPVPPARASEPLTDQAPAVSPVAESVEEPVLQPTDGDAATPDAGTAAGTTDDGAEVSDEEAQPATPRTGEPLPQEPPGEAAVDPQEAAHRALDQARRAMADGLDVAIRATLEHLTASGSSPEDATAAIRERLDALSEEARARQARGESDESIDAWFFPAATRAVGALVTSKPRPDPAMPPPVPYHRRCKVLENVSAQGYTLQGHRRDHWTPGEVGDFKAHVVDSAQHAFKAI